MVVDVKELRIVLEELQGILSATNVRGASKDVASFLKLFNGHDDETVEQFLRDLESRLHERAEPPVALPKKPDEFVVGRYVRMLGDAGTDESAFDAAFAMLSADKAVGKVEAEAIAFEYIGYAGGRRTWPNRKPALQAIEDWFKHIAYEAVKMIQLDKARYTG